MRNTRFHECLTFHDESRFFVERLGMTLGAEQDIRKPPVDGAANQRIQQSRTNALPSPCVQDCHAPDVPVRQQSARTNCLTSADHRDRMLADRIEFIHLDLDGNALLMDKHRLAYRHGMGSRERPTEETNLDVGRV